MGGIFDADDSRLTDMLATSLGTDVARLLLDPLVSEIRINPDGRLWENRLGSGKSFTGHIIPADRIKSAIFAVAYSVGRVCNEGTPDLSAELPGTGARFQAVLPPVSASPTIAIRKKATRIFTLSDMESQGVITPAQRLVIEKTTLGRGNILVVGGTDSGKTTFANAILDVLAGSKERIVIIEDTVELQCQADDVLRLRTQDQVRNLRDLVRVTMRLSPDRIVIGEVRGCEALELLKAWNTGHGGGVSTVHASSAAKGLTRLEQLIAEAGVQNCKYLIAEAISLVVYMEKEGTKRVVREIATVSGYTADNYELCYV